MKLIDYLKNGSDLFDKARLARLAKRTEKAPGYLWQVATGWNSRRASPELAILIEKATRKNVTRHDLRPDLWPTQPEETPLGRTQRAARTENPRHGRKPVRSSRQREAERRVCQ